MLTGVAGGDFGTGGAAQLFVVGIVAQVVFGGYRTRTLGRAVRAGCKTDGWHDVSPLTLFVIQRTKHTANKTYSEQNQLVKLNIFSPEMTQIPSRFFYNGGRKAQIVHCRLCLGTSELNYDLLNRHLTTNSSCDCGERKETSEQYILHCPRFTHVRQNTIFRLPANLLNITTLLQGDPNVSNKMNSLIFKAVLDFIAQSGRFAME